MIKPQIVNKLKSINELNLLMYLTEFKENAWIHTSLHRQQTAEYLGIAEITVKKCLKSLLQKAFINKIAKGVYTINKDIIQ